MLKELQRPERKQLSKRRWQRDQGLAQLEVWKRPESRQRINLRQKLHRIRSKVHPAHKSTRAPLEAPMVLKLCHLSKKFLSWRKDHLFIILRVSQQRKFPHPRTYRKINQATVPELLTKDQSQGPHQNTTKNQKMSSPRTQKTSLTSNSAKFRIELTRGTPSYMLRSILARRARKESWYMKVTQQILWRLSLVLSITWSQKWKKN